ncbi:hypothetical protein GCM10022212_10610 [Actimicrobium antarcticum]|uniref:Uncharacterized protein n=1 Tax=Actimicrobium antarcticum TaxID=1051899 RepID=A0ABP7SVU4_9BURK
MTSASTRKITPVLQQSGITLSIDGGLAAGPDREAGIKGSTFLKISEVLVL